MAAAFLFSVWRDIGNECRAMPDECGMQGATTGHAVERQIPFSDKTHTKAAGFPPLLLVEKVSAPQARMK